MRPILTPHKIQILKNQLYDIIRLTIFYQTILLLWMIASCITLLNLLSVAIVVQFEQFVSVINQLDTQNFCFTISLFYVSTCFRHMCSS